MRKAANQLKETLKKYNNILIHIKGSPDPDAIASSYAFKLICDNLNINSTILATTMLSLPQNREFVKTLNIPLKFKSELNNIKGFDSYAVLDHQSVNVENITGKLPCAIHIDHHDDADEDIDVGFRLVDQEAGSTCTLVTLLLNELNLELDEQTETDISTALLFGIETDTDKYAHASKIDYRALEILSKHSDSGIINRLSGMQISVKITRLKSKAIKNKYIYKDWLITGIGFIDESDRDVIAIIADFLLKREDVTTIIVFAAINKTDDRLFLDASFRTNDENINLNSIIKEITSEGGGRKFKGAFQINLDYFYNCPDKKMLWEVIRLTTIEVLSRQRDRMYITELRGFFNKFRHKVSNLFND